MPTAVVLGGGLSGLIASSTLSQNGFKTLLLEKDQALGGLASSYLIDREYIPKTYHHVMHGDLTTLRIIHNLGLQDQLYWRKLRVGFYSNGESFDFSSSLSILRFKPLSLRGRIKFGLLVYKARRKADWGELEGTSVEEFCKSKIGEAYKLVDYIVQAKFAEPPSNVSAAWLMSRFGHESKSVSNRFGYLRGGVEKIVKGLAKICTENSGIIKTGTEVIGIKPRAEEPIKVEYEEKGKKRETHADVVISTLPIPEFLKVARELPNDYRKSLTNVRYKSSLCAAVALSERISPYYWLNIMDVSKHPFVGVFEHGHLNSELPNPSVMFVVKYLDAATKFWRKPDVEIIEEFLVHLSEILDCNVKERVLWWRLHRAEYSTPLFTPSYGRYMPRAETPIRGLYIGGISRTYPKDRYMGTALQTGLEAAQSALLART